MYLHFYDSSRNRTSGAGISIGPRALLLSMATSVGALWQNVAAFWSGTCGGQWHTLRRDTGSCSGCATRWNGSTAHLARAHAGWIRDDRRSRAPCRSAIRRSARAVRRSHRRRPLATSSRRSPRRNGRRKSSRLELGSESSLIVLIR